MRCNQSHAHQLLLLPCPPFLPSLSDLFTSSVHGRKMDSYLSVFQVLARHHLWQRLTQRGAEGKAGSGRLQCRSRTVLRSGTSHSVYSVCVQLRVPLADDASNTAGLAAAKPIPANRTFAAAYTDLQLQNCTWLCSDNSTSAEPALQHRGNSLFSSDKSTLKRGLPATDFDPVSAVALEKPLPQKPRLDRLPTRAAE